MELSKIKPNPNNPRVIKDDSFKKLCKSIQDFPKMMSLRPIIVDNDNMILGGNMRFKALQHLGFKEIPDEWVKRAADLTDDEQRRFIITDNVSGGEWDWETLKTEWDLEILDSWGLDVPIFDNGDIVELDQFVTTYNVNIKCETPDELDEIKQLLGITSNQIAAKRIKEMINV